MDELDSLFKEAERASNPSPETFSDKVIHLVEEEFKGYSEEQRSRKEEKEYLIGKLRKYKTQYNKCKNVKNPKLRDVNKKRKERRIELKKRMALCEMRLKEIQDEEEGAGISLTDNVETI